MKIVTLSPERFDKFTQEHRYKNYFQTSQYGNLMKNFGYNVSYLGVVSDTNKLIGATLLLYKQVFMSYKKAYAPRGFLLNYENFEDIEELTKLLKRTLGKQGFISLKIDPYIPLTVRDSAGAIMNFTNQGNNIIDNLRAAGFKYRGKTTKFENEKPRWEGLIILENNLEELFNKFDKRTRNKIRRGINFGIEVSKDKNKKIDKLYSYLPKETRKSKNYYSSICKYFKDNAEIYYAKVNTETYTINSRRAYENELENNSLLANLIQDPTTDIKQKSNILNKKMESDRLLETYKSALIHATELLKKHPEGIIVGAALVIKYNQAAFLIAEGIDQKYKSQNPDYVIKWKLIEDYANEHLKYINLNGIIGEFEKSNPINEKKLGFNTSVVEYIGEFDVVINKFKYNIYKNFIKK